MQRLDEVIHSESTEHGQVEFKNWRLQAFSQIKFVVI